MTEKSGKFIIKFIAAIFEIAKHLPDAFIRESWHYKDLRMAGIDPDRVYKGLGNLQYRGYITHRNNNYKFTARGAQWLRNKAPHRFKRPERWDGKWRIVLFDIPQEYANARTEFRRKLLAMGFYQMQKSVLVYPYPCFDEVADFARIYEVTDYVDLVEAVDIGHREEILKNYYDLFPVRTDRK